MSEGNAYRQMIGSMGGVASFGRGVSMRPLIRQGKAYVSVVAVDEPQVNDILDKGSWSSTESLCSAKNLPLLVQPHAIVRYISPTGHSILIKNKYFSFWGIERGVVS